MMILSKWPKTRTLSKIFKMAVSKSTALQMVVMLLVIILSKNICKVSRVGNKKLARSCFGVQSIIEKISCHEYCVFVNSSWRAANFLYEHRQAYEAGNEICQGSRIYPPGQHFESARCVSGYKLVNGEKVSCHGEFYYFQWGQPNSPGF